MRSVAILTIYLLFFSQLVQADVPQCIDSNNTNILLSTQKLDNDLITLESELNCDIVFYVDTDYNNLTKTQYKFEDKFHKYFNSDSTVICYCDEPNNTILIKSYGEIKERITDELCNTIEQSMHTYLYRKDYTTLVNVFSRYLSTQTPTNINRGKFSQLLIMTIVIWIFLIGVYLFLGNCLFKKRQNRVKSMQQRG